MPSPKGNRNLALEYIPGLIEEGYTNTEIVRLLKEQGLAYRNQTMFADINFARLEHFGAQEIRGIEAGQAIPERLMRSREIRAGYPYSAVVKYEYTDPETGLTFESGTTLYFSERPSQEDVLREFEYRRTTLEELYPSLTEISGAEKVYYYRNIGE